MWKEHWDVVILDLTMPGRSGLEVLKEIKHAHPLLPVLILSMHPEDQFAVRLLKAGAAGYMTKESAPEELVGAVKKAVAGGRYVSPALAEKMASFLINDTNVAPHENLSDREFLILRLIASGKSVSIIARELSLSVKTVSTYRSRVLEKLSLSNNAELLHYAFQNHLVEQRSKPLGSVMSPKQAETPVRRGSRLASVASKRSPPFRPPGSSP